MLSQDATYRFGPFELRPRARELYKRGTRLKLRPQPFLVLQTLVERAGDVVTREEFRQLLWRAETFVDFEHGLNTAIKELRRLLSDSAISPRYIETLPKLGYRIIIPVTSDVAGPLKEVLTAQEAKVAPAAAEKFPKRINPGLAQPRWAIPVAIAVLLIAGLGAYVAWPRIRSRPQQQVKVATEPFFDVKGRESVRSSNPPRSSPVSGEVRDLYLKGMYFGNKRTVAGFQQAIECFQQATTLDPNYALAYAGLANSYTLLTAYSSASATLYMPQARAAATRALELDQNLSEAHTALALIVQNDDWDWQTSEKEYRRAIELNPAYATAHHWYAEHLMWLGRFDEALSESERARQLDPLSLIIAADNGAILYFSRQYDRAIEQFRTVLRKDPNFTRAGIIAYAYVEKGMFTEALAEAEMPYRLYGEGPWYWSRLAYIYGREGQPERARRELEKLEKLSRHEQVDPVTMLWSHLGEGNKEEALADLEKAYSEHFGILTTLKVEPAFDPLRTDPRFQDLLRRVHLAP